MNRIFMVKYPKVCIIILNWNGKELLKDCLSSLFRLTNYPNYNTVVVDNGSTDGSIEFVKKNFQQVNILALDKNYGVTKGINEGIRHALKKYNPQYILLLSNDTEIIQKDWLTRMVEVAESDDKIGIVGCKLLYPNGRIQHAGVNLSKLIHRGYNELSDKYNEIEEINAVTGACFLIKKIVLYIIGGLDEVYLFVGEDVDYCIRAKKFGFKIFYVGNVKLIHKEGTTIKKSNNDYYYFFVIKGIMIVYFRYFSLLRKMLIIIKSFIQAFISKKNHFAKVSISNIIINKSVHKRLFYFFKALFISLTSCHKFLNSRFY